MRQCVDHNLLAVAVVAFLFGAACGGDSGATPDAAVDPTVDAAVVVADAGIPGPFDDPTDFSRSGCETPPDLDSVDLTGIWHLDMSLPGWGSFAQTLRIDPGQGGAQYSARLFGVELDKVTVSATDVFMRRAWVSGQGTERVNALTLCRINPDNSVSGFFATCRDGDCTEGPLDAYRVDGSTEPISSNITLIAEYNGPSGAPWPTGGTITANVRVQDGVAYLVRFEDGLRIVDVSTPSNPQDLGHSQVAVKQAEIYNDVKLIDGTDGNTYALVASNIRGVVAIDVSNPASPLEVSSFPPVLPGENRSSVHTIFIEGTRAYLANDITGGIDIYDVSDPPNPALLGSYVHPAVGFGAVFVHDLFVENQTVYLNYWGLGMVIVDASDPSSPAIVGTFDSYERRTSHSNWVTNAGGRKISVHGDEDFDAHVRIVDVAQGTVAFLDEIGSFQTRRQVSVHNIMAVGDLAFVTYYQDGFRVLDLADPTQPVEIAHYRTWPGTDGLGPEYGYSFYEGAIGVEYEPVSGLIYVADTHRGLFIFRLNLP